MSSKVVGAHIAPVKKIVPAGDLPPGTLVKIFNPFDHVEASAPNFGIITANADRTVDLISLTEPQDSWSHLEPGHNPLVEPLPPGSQIVLEVTKPETEEVSGCGKPTFDLDHAAGDDWGV